jgi:hypothetical protein
MAEKFGLAFDILSRDQIETSPLRRAQSADRPAGYDGQI